MLSKKINGIWFYGVSGSGKSFISNYLKKKIKNSVIIDGDKVRKYVSFDLNYSLRERKIQIKRILGIGKIILFSKKFPIISSVYFNKKILDECLKLGIYPLKIVRKDKAKIKKNNPTYRNKKNIVGIDIHYGKFKTDILINNERKNFWITNIIIKKLIN